MLLVTGDGLIIASNRAAVASVVSQQLVGSRLIDIVNDPPERVNQFLKQSRRSRDFCLGALEIRRDNSPGLKVRAEGTLVQPSFEGNPAIVMLRLTRKDEAVTP